MKKTILFYVYTLTKLPLLIDLSNKIKDSFHILFIIADSQYISLLKENNIEYICLHDVNSKDYIPISLSRKIMRNSYLSEFLDIIKNNSFGQLFWSQLFLNDYRYYYKNLTNIVKNNNVSLFVTIHDKEYFSINNALLKIAKDLNIKIILPYFMSVNPDSKYLVVKNNPLYTLDKKSPFFQKVIFKKLNIPKYKDYYPLPAYLMFALYRFGTLSKMPWLDGAGLSDLIILSNETGKRLHLKMNIDENKLRIIGDTALEDLYNNFLRKDSLKQNIYKKYRINNSKKIMLVNLSHWWEHNMADKDTHFNIVHNTIETALKFKDEYGLILLLHPSMKLKNYKYLEKKYNIFIANEKTIDILPVVDVYVTNYSSTVVWSLLCNIKTIVVGYHEKLNLYNDFKSVKIIDKIVDMSSGFKKYLEKDIDFSYDHTLLSKEKVFHYKIVENYIKLFDESIGE